METGIHGPEVVLLLLLLFVAVFAALARRLQTPYPIVLVIAGLLLGFVPGMPRVTLDPELIFLAVLPPLLFSAAWLTSWRDFSWNFVSIAMLAVGLVVFTVWGVATAGTLFFGFDWRIGFALGATVATTDAIAATSIAKRIGLPKKIVDLLEGESLINDATGLVALEFAIMIMVDDQTPTVGAGIWRLGYLSVAAIATGLLLARLVEWLERKLDDGPIEIAISFLVPYAAYLSAEAIHASGVLAVVTAGLYIGRQRSSLFSPRVRVQMSAVWESLTFIVNGFVFVLIGLQLPWILAGVRERSTSTVILYGALFSLFLILLRLAVSFPGAYASHFIRTRILRQNHTRPDAKQIFIVGWTGMRGVIALAAAMSLPEELADGRPFPHRDLIIFLTFTVILVTLVFQGLTLPPLIRLLGLVETTGAKVEAREARRLIVEETLASLEELRQRDSSGFTDLHDDLVRHYEHRAASMGGNASDRNGSITNSYARYLGLSREFLNLERTIALRLRDQGRITDELLRDLEHELDLNEMRLAAAQGEADMTETE